MDKPIESFIDRADRLLRKLEWSDSIKIRKIDDEFFFVPCCPVCCGIKPEYKYIEEYSAYKVDFSHYPDCPFKDLFELNGEAE